MVEQRNYAKKQKSPKVLPLKIYLQKENLKIMKIVVNHYFSANQGVIKIFKDSKVKYVVNSKFLNLKE